ncbi:hypothetical protein BME39_03660 [Klebsiella quasipneumoniae subsp. similipneumoniae]|nr:hypothetical protein BME39_03660 [Klebsiella quasipneumoniae subsp. similipneumoniae]
MTPRSGASAITVHSFYGNRLLSPWRRYSLYSLQLAGNDSNLLIVFYVQIMPDDFVMQLHRF